MTYRAFIQTLAAKSGLTPSQTENYTKALANLISRQVAEGKSVTLTGFGTFELKSKPARTMYNPTTQEYRNIPSRQTLGFRPSNVLKEKMKR